MIKVQLQATMTERDLEEFLGLVREWQRKARGGHTMEMCLFGSMRSKDEIDGILRRLGLQAIMVADPFTMGHDSGKVH